MFIQHFTVPARTSEVWNLLNNPEHLAHQVANVTAFELGAPDSFSLTINVDTGLGFALYEFDCHMGVVEAGRRLQITAMGTHAHNVVEFRADVTLQENGSATDVQAEIAAVARGGLASVAQRTVCGIIVRHVQDWLNQALHAQAASA